jgi:hypothetical protein
MSSRRKPGSIFDPELKKKKEQMAPGFRQDDSVA